MSLVPVARDLGRPLFLARHRPGRDGKVDVAAVWIQITSISFPERPYTRPRHSSGATSTPTPLPPNIPTPTPYPILQAVPQGPVQPDLFLDRVGLIGMIAGFVILFIAPPVGVGCLVGFGVLWAGLYSQRASRAKLALKQTRVESERVKAYNDAVEANWRAENPDWYREHRRRAKKLEEAESKLADLESRIRNSAVEAKRQFGEAGQILRRAKTQHDNAKVDYAAELADLAKNSRKIQTERYLDSLLIRDAKLKKITMDRILSLSSFGIETALDVEKLGRVKVPGIGPVLTTRLFEWRDSSVRAFRPQQGIPAMLRASVDQRHQGQLQKSEVILANGPRQLREIIDRHESELRLLFQDIQYTVADWTKPPPTCSQCNSSRRAKRMKHGVSHEICFSAC